MEANELLKKVRKIEIKSRGLTNHIFSGYYHSAFKGKGMAFSKVREYRYGDDIRNIDWNVTARLNHPYIKVFEEERELTVMLLIDVSGSNNFGTQKNFKKDIISEIAAVLSFSAIQNNDKVGVIMFSDIIEKFIPPKKGSSHILRIVRELINFKPKNTETNISEALKYFTNIIKKRCTAFIISDFLDNNFEQALGISCQKHDIIALKIFDDIETQIPDVGIIKLNNAETNEDIWIDTSDRNFRANYISWHNTHKRYIENLFTKNGIDNISISANEDYVKPLIKLFKQREKRY